VIAAFASLLLAAAPPPAPAAAPPPCSPAAARRMTHAQIAAAGELFDGVCVRMSGIGSDRTLFDSREGVYRGIQAGGWFADPHRLDFHHPDVEAATTQTGARRLVVTGRLWTCMVRVGPNSWNRVDGVRHCSGRPHILLADRIEWTWDRSRPLERLVGEEMRARFGNLVEATEAWPRLPAARAAAAEFLDALRSADRARMARLHGGEVGDGSAYIPLLLNYLFDNYYGPFQQLHQRREVQTAIFVPRRRPWQPAIVDHPRATICYCRTADCTGLWPISSGDETGSDRPYACTAWEAPIRIPFSNAVPPPETAGVINTYASAGWLAEPSQSAFRR
jgi:hypothetical protein